MQQGNPGPALRRPAAPLLVLLVSLLLTAAATLLVASMSRARDEARFEHAVDGARDRIVSRLGTYETLLRAGAAFLSASDSVSVDEFELFVTRFRLEERYPGIQGIGFSARVRPEERNAFIAAQRTSRFPDFRIWPEAAPGEEDHSIAYLFPLDPRNAAAIGYNMYSDSTRRAAMAGARDRGAATMSGRVTLVQEIQGPAQAGFLLYSPVFLGGLVPETEAERRARLHGFVYAPFRADDLFQGIFGSEQRPHVAFRVYDGMSQEPDALLHDSRTQGIEAAASPRFAASDTVRVGGRLWTVAFTSTAVFDAESRQRAWVVMLLLGALSSLALYLLTRQQVAARRRAEVLAVRLQETNETLRTTNERLEMLRSEADAARDEARSANQAKSDFLASMSHELRTPLNAIMGYAELLDLGIHGPVTDDQRRALDRIRRSQTHLLGLINDILNYAKLEAGRVEVAQEEVPLRGLFADLQAMTEPQVQQRGLTATFEVCSDRPTAWGDGEKIQQILLNLLTNAIKFTDPGGAIRVDCVDDEADVLVRVSDTGQGIARDRLVSIFDPFVQVSRSGGQNGQHGVGLGLAISRDLAKLMQGELTVESELGSGSVFTLRLPAPPAASGTVPRENERSTAPAK